MDSVGLSVWLRPLREANKSTSSSSSPYAFMRTSPFPNGPFPPVPRSLPPSLLRSRQPVCATVRREGGGIRPPFNQWLPSHACIGKARDTLSPPSFHSVGKKANGCSKIKMGMQGRPHRTATGDWTEGWAIGCSLTAKYGVAPEPVSGAI